MSAGYACERAAGCARRPHCVVVYVVLRGERSARQTVASAYSCSPLEPEIMRRQCRSATNSGRVVSAVRCVARQDSIQRAARSGSVLKIAVRPVHATSDTSFTRRQTNAATASPVHTHPTYYSHSFARVVVPRCCAKGVATEVVAGR